MPSDIKKEISCRITRTLLMYVREKNGGTLGDFLTGLELDETYLSDPNNWVSHHFLQVLYKRMIGLLGDDNTVYNMTLSAGRFQSLGLLDPMVRLLGSPKMIFSQAPKYNKLLKLNGTVFIREIGDSWVLLEDRYHDSTQKTRFDCDYTRGVLSGIPTLFGMPMAEVEEIECQVAPEKYGRRTWPDNPPQGCRGCLYRVHWNPKARPSLWKRLFSGRQDYRRAIEDLQNANQLIQAKYDEVKKLVADLEKANRDLTASKRQLESQRAALIASERRYRLLADNVKDIIWTMDLNMKFTYYSPSVERLVGFTPEEAVARSLRETLTPDSYKTATEVFFQELEKLNKGARDPESAVSLELEITCKDGSTIMTEIQTSFLYDAQGQPTGVIGITRDISDRKKADQEKRNLEKQLVQAQKMESIGNIAKGIAHEFNNVLGIILGNAEMAGTEIEESNPVSESLEEIKRASLRAKAVVKQLLTFSRRMDIRREPIDIREIVQEVATLMRAAIPANVKIQELSSAEIDAVVADSTQIHQLVINLCTNAAQAMSEDGGTLAIELYNMKIDDEAAAKHPDLQPGAYVKLSIRDTGQGIAQDMMDKVFDPYFTTKDVGQGTGMGLAVVHGIAKAHRAVIEIDSTVGKGTTFHVYFPASKEKPRRAETAEQALPTGSERILFVDDELSIVRIGVKVLTKLGYSVSSDTDPLRATARFSADPYRFDLVISDMTMPGMSGDALVKNLMETRPDIPVIICTGYSDRMSPDKAREMGIKGLLMKPIEQAELARMVRKVLDGARDAAEGE